MTTAETLKSLITQHEQQLNILKRELFEIQSSELERIKTDWRPSQNDTLMLTRIQALQQSFGDFGITFDICFDIWTTKQRMLCNYVEERMHELCYEAQREAEYEEDGDWEGEVPF